MFYLFIFKYKFIYFNWRLITSQYCIGSAIHQHESTTGIRMFPILNRPPCTIPLVHPSAPAPSILYPTSNTHYQRNANKNHNEVPFHTSQNRSDPKSTSNKFWRGCGEKGNLLYCWWECKLVQPLRRTVWRKTLKTANRTALWPSNPTAGYTHRGNQNWKRHMYPNVHCSTVYNSQDMETT